MEIAVILAVWAAVIVLLVLALKAYHDGID